MTDLRAEGLKVLRTVQEDPAGVGGVEALKALARRIFDACAVSRDAARAVLSEAYLGDSAAEAAFDRAALTATLGLHLTLPPLLCRHGVTAALICDLGEHLLPASVVRGSVTWAAHPRLTLDLLPARAFDARVEAGVLAHHERLDGSGAPYGLEGDGIGPVARLIAVADAYCRRRMTLCPADAMEQMRELCLPGLDRTVFGALVECVVSNLSGWERVPA